MKALLFQCMPEQMIVARRKVLLTTIYLENQTVKRLEVIKKKTESQRQDSGIDVHLFKGIW